MRTVSVSVMGGLGNQLFIIFAALGYAIENNCLFVFDDSPLIGPRKKTYWNSFLKSLDIYCNTSIQPNIIYREPFFKYSKIPMFPNNQDVHLSGYFQSYKYFHKHKNHIFNLIHLDLQQNSVATKISSKHDYTRTISLHFRLGDYKNLPEFHPILPLSYYRTALKHMQDLEKWTVLYFCENEDMEEVNIKVNTLREEFPLMTFERFHEEQLDDWEEMLAMSLCRHHIIANSTFSFFGAYFDTSPESQVCYPSQWFGPALSGHDTSEICPPNWIKI